MSGFTKLVPEIIQSSIWNETAEIRCVWIAMIATKDADGYVRGDARTIARMANVSPDAVEAALEMFQQPDPSSHTPDNDGRRIIPAPGGWIILNHDLYRCRDDVYRERTRERVRKHRAKVDSDADVTLHETLLKRNPSASASVSASSSASDKGKSTRFIKPTPAEVTAYAKTIDFDLDGENFCNFYESKGWKVGNTPMKKWQAAVCTWKKRDKPQKTAKEKREYDEPGNTARIFKV